MSEDELWSYISPEPIKNKLELVKNQGDSTVNGMKGM